MAEDGMTGRWHDWKVSLKKLKKRRVYCNVYTLKVPNFFTLPEFGPNYQIDSPAFEFANATWRFQFKEVCNFQANVREFGVYMESTSEGSSEIPSNWIFHKVSLLDANDKEYDYDYDIPGFLIDSEIVPLGYFNNEKPSYDRRSTLTLITHLICREPTEQDCEDVWIQGLHDEMAEMNISLKLSKESIYSDVYTLKVPNVTVKEYYDGTRIQINSPSFEFANQTWCFQIFLEDMFADDSSIYNVKMNTEKNEFNIKQKIFYLITSLDDNKSLGPHLSGVHDFENCNERSVRDCLVINKEKFSVEPDILDFSIEIFSDEVLDVDADMSRTMNRDVNPLCCDLRNLLLNEINTDLTLRVVDKEFRVHQAILKTRSGVFEAMLNNDMLEKSKGVIDVPDCDPQVMQQFLLYVYSGKVDTLNHNAFGLYYAADKYNITLLKEICAKYLKKFMSPSEICDVIQLALNHNDTDLLEHATEYFVNHCSGILSTVEYTSFMELNSVLGKELFLKALKKDILRQITICDVMQLGLNPNDTELLEYTTEYFANHSSDILSTVEWTSFMELNSVSDKKLFLTALKKDILRQIRNHKVVKYEKILCTK